MPRAGTSRRHVGALGDKHRTRVFLHVHGHVPPPPDLTADVALSTAMNDFEDYGAQYVVITGHQIKDTIPTNAEPETTILF